MKQNLCTRNKLTAGAILLAVIFITACNVSIPSETAAVAGSVSSTAIPPATPVAAPDRAAEKEPAASDPSPSPTPDVPATDPPAAGDEATGAENSAELTGTGDASAPVEVSQTTITLPTYPIKSYLTEQIDPIYNIPVFYFDRAGYEAAGPGPTDVDYAGVVLENAYLRLTFLPELGGRLYSAVVKATDQEIFYHNPVVKPSRFGVLQPYEANWWLATGGMEWAYPTQEHGYRFGVPWTYQVDQGRDEATIVLSDSAADRVGLEVKVTLPAESMSFTVEPTLTNNGSDTAPMQLWTNAALTLGTDTMTLDTRFVVPSDMITVHSRGESGWSVPGARQVAPWPQVDNTDLSYYSQWANYLGFFVPNQETPFTGAYNPTTNLGVVRLPDALPGSGKVFAFGKDFSDKSYTDDGSQYFELWGGANAGFWAEDDVSVPVGGTLGWKEYWWPLAQLGGITWATAQAAIHIDQANDMVTLTALMPEPTHGTLVVTTDSSELLRESFLARPDTPQQWSFSAPTKPVTLTITDDDNATLLEYEIN